MSAVDYNLDALPVPVPKSDRVVVTLAAGPEGRELYAVSGPFLRAYAAKVGADFHAIEVPEAGDFVCAWKWQAWRVLHRYRRMLWVDADAIVRPATPDVFAAVAEDEFAAVDEGDDFREQSPDGGRWWRTEVSRLQSQLNAVQCAHPFSFNGGVYVASRCHLSVLAPPDRPLDLTFCGEQHLLNERLFKLGTRVRRLPSRWNARWMWQQEGCFDPANYIVHLSGCRPHAARIDLLKREAAAWR